MGTMVVDQLCDIIRQAYHLADITEDLVIPITWDKRTINMDLIRTADAVQSLLDGAVREMEEYLTRAGDGG